MSVTRIQFGADGQLTERSLEAAMVEAVNDPNEMTSIAYRDVADVNAEYRHASLSINGTPGANEIERLSTEARIFYEKQVKPHLVAPANETDVQRRSREATLARNTAILNGRIDNVEAAAELARSRGLYDSQTGGVTEAGLAGLKAEAARLNIK